VTGRRPQCSAGAVQQGVYSIGPIHWNIQSSPASPGRSRFGPALYLFSLLELDISKYGINRLVFQKGLSSSVQQSSLVTHTISKHKIMF
jgi:hypothetical protein